MEFIGSVFVVLSGKKPRTENFVLFMGNISLVRLFTVTILFGLVLIFLNVNWGMLVYVCGEIACLFSPNRSCCLVAA